MARDVLLTPDQVSEMLGVSTQTLATWRATNRYPLEYVKVGSRLVRYRQSDVNEFLDASTQGGDDDEVDDDEDDDEDDENDEERRPCLRCTTARATLDRRVGA